IEIISTPSRARKLVRSGDVLVSTVRPERGAVGVVSTYQDGSICTTGLAVLRPKAIHPVLLAYLLKTSFVTAQLLRNNIGIAYPAISEDCLLDVLLPITWDDIRRFKDDTTKIVELEHHLHEMRQSFAERLDAANQRWRQLSLNQAPKPHRAKQTTSHLRSRREDSGSRGQEILPLE